MPTTEISALPVLVPTSMAAFAVVLWWLRRRDCMTGPRVAVGMVACVYGAAVLSNVLFPFQLGTGDDPVSWRVWLHVTPLVDAFGDPIGIVLNTALFVPLGLLLPLVARVASARRALLYGFVVSLGIEVVQFVADVSVSSGRVADVDDLIGNCLGTLVGYLIFRLAVLVPVVARTAVRATWPAPGRGGPDRDLTSLRTTHR